MGRGLWIEVLNAMFNSDSHTLAGTPADLARLLRCSEAEFHAALSELTAHNAACHSNRNGIVTLTSRRLERKSKDRSLAKLRQQKHRSSQNSHVDVRSASEYASASASSFPLGKGSPEGRGLPDFEALQGELNRLFQRAEGEPWGYLELSTAGQIVRERPNWREELAILKAFKLKGEYFPQSLQSLLEKWAQTLDRARNGTGGKPSTPRIGPQLSEVSALVAEKWPDDPKGPGWAATFYRYWNEPKRNWRKKDGKSIDWKVELSAQVSKWRTEA